MSTTQGIDNFLSELELVSQLDSQIDSVLFRLSALKNGKTLSFRLSNEEPFKEWCPSYTNMNAILEGNDNHPSIIQMDVQWSISG